jgi:hypothetical protein
VQRSNLKALHRLLDTPTYVEAELRKTEPAKGRAVGEQPTDVAERVRLPQRKRAARFRRQSLVRK